LTTPPGDPTITVTPGDPAKTNPPSQPTQINTVAPPTIVESPSVLIPVTGADLSQVRNGLLDVGFLREFLVNIGVIFLGLGIVLSTINKKFS
jgi:hypothetical protein